VGVILKGRLILVEDKATLMKKLGKRTLTVSLAEPLSDVPPALAPWGPVLKNGGAELEYVFDAASTERPGVAGMLRALSDAGIGYKDLNTQQSSLEDIFVGLLHGEGVGA